MARATASPLAAAALTTSERQALTLKTMPHQAIAAAATADTAPQPAIQAVVAEVTTAAVVAEATEAAEDIANQTSLAK